MTQEATNTMNLQEECLAKIDASINNLKGYVAHLKIMLDADSHKSEPDWAIVQYLDMAENSLKGFSALRAALAIPDRGDSGFFNPELNAHGAIHNNALDIVRHAIAKELGVDVV